MIYHYHPILGLQYFMDPIVVVNLNHKPDNPMTWEEAFELIRAKGIYFFEGTSEIIDCFSTITTNAISTFNNLF